MTFWIFSLNCRQYVSALHCCAADGITIEKEKEGKAVSNNTRGTIFVVVVVVVFIILAAITYSQPRKDVVHDPDGFLGYSDSFWEWQAQQ